MRPSSGFWSAKARQAALASANRRRAARSAAEASRASRMARRARAEPLPFGYCAR